MISAHGVLRPIKALNWPRHRSNHVSDRQISDKFLPLIRRHSTQPRHAHSREISTRGHERSRRRAHTRADHARFAPGDGKIHRRSRWRASFGRVEGTNANPKYARFGPQIAPVRALLGHAPSLGECSGVAATSFSRQGRHVERWRRRVCLRFRLQHDPRHDLRVVRRADPSTGLPGA